MSWLSPKHLTIGRLTLVINLSCNSSEARLMLVRARPFFVEMLLTNRKPRNLRLKRLQMVPMATKRT